MGKKQKTRQLVKIPECSRALHFLSVSALVAKQVMELLGSSQSTFGDMVSELDLSAAMRPKAEYTLLAPLNSAFTGTVIFLFVCFLHVQLWFGIWKNLHDKRRWSSWMVLLFSPQRKWCPWIRGCSRSSWRTTSWKTKWCSGSCTTGSSWRPSGGNIWGSSSIAQCVHFFFFFFFLNLCPDVAVVSR